MSKRPPEPASDLPSPRATAIVIAALGVLAAGAVLFLAYAPGMDAAIERAGGPPGLGKSAAAPTSSAAAVPPPRVATRIPVTPHENLVLGAFYVGADGPSSYRGVFEDDIVETMDEALGARLAASDGAAVRVIAVEEAPLGHFARYERLDAVEVRRRDPLAKPQRFYGFTGEQARGYFDAAGKQPVVSGWQPPLEHLRRTSKFDPKRLHPVLHVVKPHEGTDYGAPTGTPVYAAYKGVVDWIGPHGPTGNWISIIHPNGVETGYAHLSKFAPGLKRGDAVRAHQLIGYVGTTGRSTGPHLHFSARKNGKFFDAETLLARGEREIPDVDRAAFLAAKAELDRQLDAIELPPEPPMPVPAPALSSGVEPRTVASSRAAHRRVKTP